MPSDAKRNAHVTQDEDRGLMEPHGAALKRVRAAHALKTGSGEAERHERAQQHGATEGTQMRRVKRNRGCFRVSARMAAQRTKPIEQTPRHKDTASGEATYWPESEILPLIGSVIPSERSPKSSSVWGGERRICFSALPISANDFSLFTLALILFT
jgi:hypothetical protein